MKKLILIFALLLGANTVRAQYGIDTVFYEVPNHSILTISETWNGVKHGKCTNYDNGRLVSVDTYFHGDLDGPFVNYYRTTPKPVVFSTGNHVANKYEGIVHHYSKDGEYWGGTDYRSGRIVGRLAVNGEYTPVIPE